MLIYHIWVKMAEELAKSEETQLETIEPSEVAPLSEVLGEVATEEEKINWAPLEENQKIIDQLNILAKNLSKIKKLELHRNPGKTHYRHVQKF